MTHIAGGVGMKQNRWVTFAKRWRLAAPGWTLVVGSGFVVAAITGTFHDMRPVAIFPPHIWATIALIAAWAWWESGRKVVVVPSARDGQMTVAARGAILFAVAILIASCAGLVILSLPGGIAVAWQGPLPLAITILLPAKLRRWRTVVVILTLLLGIMCVMCVRARPGFAWQTTRDMFQVFSILIFPQLALSVLAVLLLRVSTREQSSSTASRACAACGYDLRLLTHTRCPECGKPFVSFDSFIPTHPLKSRVPWPSVRLLGIGACLMLFSVFVHPSMQMRYHEQYARQHAMAAWEGGDAFVLSRSARMTGRLNGIDMATGMRCRLGVFCGNSPWTSRYEFSVEADTFEKIIRERRAKWPASVLRPADVATELTAGWSTPGEETPFADHLANVRVGEFHEEKFRFRGGTLDMEHCTLFKKLADGRILTRLYSMAVLFSPEGDWLQAYEEQQPGQWVAL